MIRYCRADWPRSFSKERFHMTASASSSRKHQIVIVGGGTGGTSVAALLLRRHPGLDVVVIDPAPYHYYQPAWTLVGGGAYRAEDTRRDLHSVLPSGAKYIADKVSALLPYEQQVELGEGRSDERRVGKECVSPVRSSR